MEELAAQASKKKLLILLTDGKPTDLDHYEGRYGIEDMRHALLEAQQAGVHVQALEIDSEAKFYFPQIFSQQNYQILSDPKNLPEQLFKIYFGFTREAKCIAFLKRLNIIQIRLFRMLVLMMYIGKVRMFVSHW